MKIDSLEQWTVDHAVELYGIRTWGAGYFDVAPDGTAYNLESAGHEVVRASYRDKTVERKLVQPGQVVKISYDNLLTGNTFKKGHRLRVYIMGSWFPVYSRNLQTGQLETTSSGMKKATINILYGPSHPSGLVLPLAP